MFKGMKKAATTKTGLNDVFGHIVWAISKSFNFYFVIYIY